MKKVTAKGDLILVIALGWLGIHKFKEKKIGIGILYMFTLGLFYAGWVYDICKTAKAYGKSKNSQSSMPTANKVEPVVCIDTRPSPTVFEQPAPAPEANSAVRIVTKRVEHDPVGELSRLDFGKPEGELGCFLNYIPRILYPPSEKQFKYLKDLGVFIPDGITNVDASCMISRVTGEDSKEGPHPSLVSLAMGLKIRFSAYIGASGLLQSIIEQASDRDLAALYAYGVRQSLRGCSFRNMLEDPELPVLYSFADQVLSEPTLMRSLKGRPAEDFKNPHRSTAIYKAAAAHLTGGNVHVR